MWQVYLYLANEHQVRQQDARAHDRRRRWAFGRRARGTGSHPTGATIQTSRSVADRAH